MKIDKTKMAQLVGVTGTILGVGATLLSNWSNDQKLEKLVDKKVTEILERKLSEIK